MKKILLTTLCSILFGTITHAQMAGDLDTTFGTNGKVMANIGLGDFIVTSQALQSDEKIVLAGSMNNWNKQYGLLVRLNDDGTLDTTFNGSGKILETDAYVFNVVKIQANGKIIAGGSFDGHAVVIRYNDDGTLDTTFAGDGVFTIEDGTNYTSAVDMVVQSDGKILLLTNFQGTTSDYRITKLNTNGTLDSTFGTLGSFYADLGSSENAKSIILQADNKIVVGGELYNTATRGFLARHNVNGTLDTTFNTVGYKIINFPGASFSSILCTVSLQADGKIVFCGRTTVSNVRKLVVGRVNTNGSADTTFDSDGFALTTAGVGDSSGNGKIKVQSDGKIVVLERSAVHQPTTNRSVLLHRYNANGTLDTSFSSDGILEYSYFSYNDYGDDFNFVGNTILVSGNTMETPFKVSIALARFTTDGNFDDNFSGDGKSVINIPYAAYDDASTSLIQPDGKILVAGKSFFNDGTYFSVARFNANGTIDTSFGTDGSTTLENFFGHGQINGMALDANGRVLIAGSSDFVEVYCLTSNGAIDTTFGVNGKADLTGNFGGAYSIQVLANGKILVAGQEATDINGVFSGNFMIARLNANGIPDTTFGTSDGISNAGSTDADNEVLFKISVLSNNKILALARVWTGSDWDIAVIRYNANGTLDTTFNGNGFSTFGSAAFDNPRDMAVQADGKILVSGVYGDSVEFLMVRINADGSTDTSFGNNGVVQTIIDGDSQSLAMKLLDNQEILLIGLAGVDFYNQNFAIAKYNANGSIDTDFGNQGVVLTDFNGGFDAASAAVITPDNMLVVTGTAENLNDSYDFALAKYYIENNLATANFEKNAITFAPNPVQDYMVFNTDVQSVTVISIEGKIIPLQLDNNRADASQLTNGVYVIHTQLENGSTFTSKFVKR